MCRTQESGVFVMSPTPLRFASVTCAPCGQECRLTDGREVYPHITLLADKPIYICDGCLAYVGCHLGTTNPLGTPAGPELRRARLILHEKMIDPLWQNAWRDPAYAESQDHPTKGRRANGAYSRNCRKDISRIARLRVYEFLADRLNIPQDQTHTGIFDLETCRLAWRALQGVTYSEIRIWAKDRQRARELEDAS